MDSKEIKMKNHLCCSVQSAWVNHEHILGDPWPREVINPESPLKYALETSIPEASLWYLHCAMSPQQEPLPRLPSEPDLGGQWIKPDGCPPISCMVWPQGILFCQFQELLQNRHFHLTTSASTLSMKSKKMEAQTGKEAGGQLRAEINSLTTSEDAERMTPLLGLGNKRKWRHQTLQTWNISEYISEIYQATHVAWWSQFTPTWQLWFGWFHARTLDSSPGACLITTQLLHSGPHWIFGEAMG